MSDLHDARVEAAVDEYLKIHLDEAGRPSIRESMRAALAAADAVVTVEMIADTAHKAMLESWTDSEEYKHAPAYIARAVIALIRGGEEQ